MSTHILNALSQQFVAIAADCEVSFPDLTANVVGSGSETKQLHRFNAHAQNTGGISIVGQASGELLTCALTVQRTWTKTGI